MREHGKKYVNAAKNRDIASTYQPRQALEIVKQSSFAKSLPVPFVRLLLTCGPERCSEYS